MLNDSTHTAIVALQKVYDEKQALIAQLQIECTQLKRSMDMLGYQRPPRAKRLVMDFLATQAAPLRPEEIYAAMIAHGIPIRKGSLHTTLRRLGATGELIHDARWNTWVVPGVKRCG